MATTGSFDKSVNKVIVTGGSGFVGSNTIKELKAQGFEVFNYDLTEGYDIRDYKQFADIVNPGDRILHLAAVARFNDADKDPLLTLETNVLGTDNVARAAKEKNADRIVYSSTGSVYMPVDGEPPITEKFTARGNSVYACAKYQGELLIRKHNPTFVILRYGHLYGEGKIGHGAIGGFIDKMSRDLKPVVYGGKQSNDFTYILDIVQANLLALETENTGEVYNIGSGEELTTEGVFNIMCDVFDYHKDFDKLPARTVDPLRFVLDISKAQKKLGYVCNYPFEKGIRHFKEIYNGYALTR